MPSSEQILSQQIIVKLCTEKVAEIWEQILVTLYNMLWSLSFAINFKYIQTIIHRHWL